jgi:hypothetical protein
LRFSSAARWRTAISSRARRFASIRTWECRESIAPVRSTSGTQRPSQRPPCRRERSKNAWRSSSVYCRRSGFLGFFWAGPLAIVPRLTAGHRSEMWLGNRSERTRAPQFLHTERESSDLSAAFSSMRRFRSLSRAFSRCSRAISVTISWVVTFAYSGTLLGPNQPWGSVGTQQPVFSRLVITEPPLVETPKRTVVAELPPAAHHAKVRLTWSGDAAHHFTEPPLTEKPPQPAAAVRLPAGASRRLRAGARRFRRGHASSPPSAHGSSARAWRARRGRRCS